MTSPDPAWLDRMYNNRALVPDHPAYFARWTEESQSVRKRLPCQIDVPYGNGAGEMLDVFPADGFGVQGGKTGQGAPVLVFIHGGYWRALDKSEHSFVAPEFTQAGACVVMPNYALCPAVTIPDITMQMVKALAWTWRHIARYGGDPDRITVVGHSAGGHLAAMLLACNWQAYGSDLPADLVKNALSISGLYELEPLRHAPFVKDSLKLTPEHAAKASPALLPAPARGTLYSVAGADESAEFLRQNLLIQQAWGSRVVPVCESHLRRNHFSVLEALTEHTHRLHLLALGLLGLSTVHE
ncbi:MULTISPECIES: alpha/beta hydrolase [unclassified Polaromonas]|uniref:alpha/beta hydrolase n=1 Tax=unclassified Polaromonas TaxID=2638319 RepID=UPI000F08B5BC|nr:MULTISPECIES: alpha/beta hydrolase [unclassified Polaromonas]AYQ26652.1 alpha/beta hydrolase [Polaromonas sp. SP1]QGJ18505.1 alpha/beta hydrolase fold domain-containing protein [Polaromonas sp. Pch-P]